MNLPRTLTVGPVRYRVTTRPKAVAKMGQEQLGCCNPDRATITLHPDQPATVMRESLLHEALHAVTDLVGVAADLGAGKDERLVRRLAPALLSLLRDNPDAVTYWTENP